MDVIIISDPSKNELTIMDTNPSTTTSSSSTSMSSFFITKPVLPSSSIDKKSIKSNNNNNSSSYSMLYRKNPVLKPYETTTTKYDFKIKEKEKLDKAEEGLIKSLIIPEPLKLYITEKMNIYIEKSILRCPIITFIRFQNNIQVFDEDNNDIHLYFDYIKELNEPIVISEKQFSRDLLYFEKDYQIFSSILQYLNKLNTPINYILSKQSIEVGIKPIKYNNNDSNIFNKMEQMISDVIRKSKNAYYYMIITDLSLSNPKNKK